MLKMIAGALVGIVIIVQGIYVWYIYMTTFLTQGNHVLFALSIFQVGVGIYILFRASKSSEQKIQTDEFGFPIKPATQPAHNLLEQHSHMLEEYNHTADLRDKLKIIESAAESQEKAEKSTGVG
jgi:hypothetical protein